MPGKAVQSNESPSSIHAGVL